jgi:hypothetical protein
VLDNGRLTDAIHAQLDFVPDTARVNPHAPRLAIQNEWDAQDGFERIALATPIRGHISFALRTWIYKGFTMLRLFMLLVTLDNPPGASDLINAYDGSRHVFVHVECRVRFRETYQGPNSLNGKIAREGTYEVAGSEPKCDS